MNEKVAPYCVASVRRFLMRVVSMSHWAGTVAHWLERAERCVKFVCAWLKIYC